MLSQIFNKARKLLRAYAKEHKKNTIKPSKQFNDYQNMLKSAPKEFRKYDRRKKIYTPITPKNKKLRNSEKFEQFIYDVNEYNNYLPSIEEEQNKQKIMDEYDINDDEFEYLKSHDMDFDDYSSDNVKVKHFHLDSAINKYGDMNDPKFRQLVNNIQRNIDNYDINAIYETIGNFNAIEKGVLSFDDFEL